MTLWKIETESMRESYPYRSESWGALTVLQGQSYVGMPKFGPTQLGCCTNGQRRSQVWLVGGADRIPGGE